MDLKIKDFAKSINIDWFLVSLFGAVALSFVFPTIGANGGPLYLEHIAKYGIFAIFFLHGAKLSVSHVKSGITAWRLHVIAQTIVFILFPFLGAMVYFSTSAFLTENQRFGIIFLCAVSSTISSSVVLTAMAKGNISGSVFSATISGILGIFLTPILVSIFHASSAKIDTIQAIVEVMKLILLPFILGQICRPLIGAVLEAHKAVVSNLDRAIIVLIVFVAFCNSNKEHIFTEIAAQSLIFIGLIVILLLFSSIKISKILAKIGGLNREDTVSAVFIGSTKSLANGVPIASVLFAGDPNIGVIILPLMLYHPLQLAVCAWLAGRWGIQKSH